MKINNLIIAALLFAFCLPFAQAATTNQKSYVCMEDIQAVMPEPSNMILLKPKNSDNLEVSWKPTGIRVNQKAPILVYGETYPANRLVFNSYQQVLTDASALLKYHSYRTYVYPAYKDYFDAWTYASRTPYFMNYSLWTKAGNVIKKSDFISGFIGESRTDNTLFISPLMVSASAGGIHIDTNVENIRTGVKTVHDGTWVSCSTGSYMMPGDANPFNCSIDVPNTASNGLVYNGPFNVRFTKNPETYIGFKTECRVSNYAITYSGKKVFDGAEVINIAPSMIKLPKQ